MEKFITVLIVVAVGGMFVFFASIMIMHQLREIKPKYKVRHNLRINKFEVQTLIGLNDNWSTIKSFDTLQEAIDWHEENCAEKK